MIDTSSRKILGLNQQTYLRLKLALSLNMRRQIFIAVCDDLPLRDRLAHQLQHDLVHTATDRVRIPEEDPSYPRLVSLQLSLESPNPIVQIAQWLSTNPPPRTGKRRFPVPAFQFLGIEYLTRQPATIQRQFLSHLQEIERSLPVLDCSLLFWMPRPWFRTLPQSAQEFWRCRTAIFEFMGDPRPADDDATAVAVPHSGPQSPAPQAPNAAHPTPKAPTDPPGWTLIHRELPRTEPPPQNPPAAAPRRKPAIALVGSKGKGRTAATTAPSSVGGLATATDPRGAIAPVIPANTLSANTLSQNALTLEKTALPAETLDPEVLEASPAPVKTVTPVLEEVPLSDRQPDNRPASVASSPAVKLEGVSAPSQPKTAPVAAVLPTTVQVLVKEVDLPAQAAIAPAARPVAVPADPEDDRQIALFREHIGQLHSQNASPVALADAYRTLADIFRDRVEQGQDTSDNLQGGIQAYEQVLIWLPETSPLWSDVLNDLGNLYWMLSRKLTVAAEAEAHLQKGIEAYELGLARLDVALHPHSVAMIHNNLGAAYADLARYQNPVVNLQQSVRAYQEVLCHRSPEVDPARYASTQNNLGTTLWNLAQHERPKEYLKQAIAAYSEALAYCGSDEDPTGYGMIQNNLGTAYWNLAQYENPQEWLGKAVAAYQLALKYRTVAVSLTAHSATQNNLGTAFWHLASQAVKHAPQRLEYWQKSITAYDAALHAVAQLKQRSPLTSLSFDSYASHTNLGLAHYQLATDSALMVPVEACSRHLELALQHHLSALQGWQTKSHLRQTALSHIVKTIRVLYRNNGLAGQNLALSMVPADLLPEILPKL